MASKQELRVIGEISVQYRLPAGDPCWISEKIGSYIPKQGDFSFIKNYTAEMLKDAWDAVEKTNGWEFMKNHGPRSYAFDDPPEKLKEINRAMKYDCHSGASYGWTMRQMEAIAKNGWANYVTKF